METDVTEVLTPMPTDEQYALKSLRNGDPGGYTRLKALLGNEDPSTLEEGLTKDGLRDLYYQARLNGIRRDLTILGDPFYSMEAYLRFCIEWPSITNEFPKASFLDLGDGIDSNVLFARYEEARLYHARRAAKAKEAAASVHV